MSLAQATAAPGSAPPPPPSCCCPPSRRPISSGPGIPAPRLGTLQAPGAQRAHTPPGTWPTPEQTLVAALAAPRLLAHAQQAGLTDRSNRVALFTRLGLGRRAARRPPVQGRRPHDHSPPCILYKWVAGGANGQWHRCKPCTHDCQGHSLGCRRAAGAPVDGVPDARPAAAPALRGMCAAATTLRSCRPCLLVRGAGCAAEGRQQAFCRLPVLARQGECMCAAADSRLAAPNSS